MQDATAQQRWIYAILAFGLLECLLLVLVLLEPAPVNATGIAHPSIPAMRIGGDSTRFDVVASYAWWLQIFVLAQAHCLAALGVKAERRTPTFLILLGGCYLLAVFVWWQMIASYEAFVVSGETTYFFGFPAATAWQTYGLWFSGAGLIALYSVGFRHYVWSDEDEAKFTALSEKAALSERTALSKKAALGEGDQ
jgi:hypothetical protein